MPKKKTKKNVAYKQTNERKKERTIAAVLTVTVNEIIS